jgi:hypothetical protein
MARYSVLLGLQVEVQYRAGDILLPASGTFVGDTGRSIFLEQSFEQRGQRRNFRWEIPYQYIVRLAEKTDSAMSMARESSATRQSVSAETTQESKVKCENAEPENVHAAVAASGSKVSVIFPRPQRSDT